MTNMKRSKLYWSYKVNECRLAIHSSVLPIR